MSVRALALLLALSGAGAACADTRPSTAQANVHVLAAMRMPGLERERTLRLYLPPGYARSRKRYPVVYMHDGQNLFDDATSFVGEWGVDETLNALAQRTHLELIVVGIDHGGPARMTELDPWDNPKYGAGEGRAYLDFIVHTVKPYIDAHYRTLPDRTHTAMIGSSLGGLISHFAMYEYGDVFGKFAILSPAYWFAPQATELARTQRLRPGTRIFFYAGGKEDDNMVPNLQTVVDLLHAPAAGAPQLDVEIAPDAAHNETAWRAVFPHAILWLFDGSR